MPAMAIAWVLRRPEVASAITGASRPEQVRADAASVGTQLTGDVLDAIDVTLDGVAVTAPTLAVFAKEGVRHR